MDKWDSMFPWACAVARAVGRTAVSRRVWVTVAIVVLAIPAAVHVRAWVFRWQARRFLNDVRALEMGKTPGAEALKLRDKYEKSPWGPSSDACTAERCSFSVATTQWIGEEGLYKRLYSADSLWHWPWALAIRVLNPAGLRPGGASATILVRHGVVVAVSPMFGVAFERGWVLVGSVSAQPNLGQYLRYGHGLVPESHPNMRVGHPDGTGSGGAWAQFTSQLSREDFLRLTDFNLSCATHTCQVNEIAPEIERWIEQDRGRRESEPDRPCSVNAMKLLGRDAESVAHLQVRAMEGAGQEVAYVDYDLLEKLKDGASLEWLVTHSTGPVLRISQDMNTPWPMIDRATGRQPTGVFRSGADVIAFFGIRGIPCGVVPATAENLAAVRAGIAEDRTEEWK